MRDDIQVRRRELVAQLHLRGLTLREIAAKVGEYVVNPNTGKPYSHETVNKDLELLKEEWRANAQADINEHIARQFVELAELRRAAWANKEYDTVLRAMAREAKLLGLDAPAKSEVKIEDWRTDAIRAIQEGKLGYDDLLELFDEDMAARLLTEAKLAGI